MYSYEDSQERQKIARSDSLKSDKFPKRSNRGSYLSLKDYQLLPDVSPPTGQTESGQTADSEESPFSSSTFLKLLQDGSIGIDKTRISVPILTESTDIDLLVKKLLGGSRNLSEGLVKIPDFPSVYIKWDSYRDRMTFTFNPSEFTWLSGYQLCPIELFIPITRFCITEVLRYGDPKAKPLFQMDEDTGEEFDEWPQDWARHCTVLTLHIAVDFRITDSRFNLSQLEGTQAKKTRGAVSIRNRSQLNTVTHIAGKKAAKLVFYDKSAERSMNPRPEAPVISDKTFRFEAQLPRRIIKRTYLQTLAGCTVEKVVPILTKHWEDAKLSGNLVWQGSLLDSLMQLFPQNRAFEIYSYAYARHLGIDCNYSELDIRRLERDMNTAKMDLRLPLQKQGQPFGRLDLFSAGLKPPRPTSTRRGKGNPFNV